MLPSELLITLNKLTLEQKQELLQWLKDQIKLQKQAECLQKKEHQQRVALEKHKLSDGITYQLELVNCGKQRCQKCANGPSHGPYWYGYYWDSKRKKMVSRYLGKKAPLDRKD